MTDVRRPLTAGPGDWYQPNKPNKNKPNKPKQPNPPTPTVDKGMQKSVDNMWVIHIERRYSPTTPLGRVQLCKSCMCIQVPRLFRFTLVGI